MARTGKFGGFDFDPVVFTDMMAEANYWSNPIIASGIVHQDNAIMSKIGTEGNVATLPFYVPLNVFDAGMAALNNDGQTDNTPVDIEGKKQTCMLIQRMKAFKAQDFTKELTGADPMGHIQKRVADYYGQVWENEMMNIADAALGVAELSDHVLNLAAESGTVGEANMVNETTLIDAEEQALGDMAGGLGLLVMHSKIFAAYQKMQLVEYMKYNTGNALQGEITLPTIGGKVVLRTNYYTVDNTGTAPVYKTYLFGEGAFLGATKSNYENPYYVDYDPESKAGIEKLYTKQGRVLHPNGLSFAADNVVNESPTFAELGTTGNWALRFNPKNIKMGLIKTNG